MSEQQPPVAAVPESTNGHSHEHENGDERAAKRARIDEPAASEPQNGTATTESSAAPPTDSRDRRSGLVAIKKEFLVDTSTFAKPARDDDDANDDDAAEGRGHSERGGDDRDTPFQGKKGKKKGKGGQNIERSFGKFDDALPLCNSRAFYNEFSPRECRFGDKCRMCHDIRKYLAEGRRPDVETFDGKCPVFAEHGYCPSGWKCRFVRSHMEEVEREDGRKELVLLDKSSSADAAAGEQDKSRDAEEVRLGIHNVVAMDVKIDLNRKRTDFSKADEYIKWLDSEATRNHDLHHMRKEDEGKQTLEDIKATFVDPPFKPSEKRRLYFGPETPTLAPLTTQGNLPYRRLCVELGAQLTYSEMAFGLPLVQGTKADWTLMKAHSSELSPPKFDGAASKTFVFDNYVPETDLKFGAQISGSAHWVTTKAANILARTCPKLRVIDLNCGCPIDMVFKSGGGSALLDAHGKLERMIRGMNAVSGEIPITAKIRMGVKSSRPNAPSVIERLAFGAKEHRERLGAPGCAAVTLHGRSREQRYTKLADWSYIGECAALIKRYNETKDALTDTAGEPDPSTQANGGHMYFLGNGDCYSHEDYYNAIDNAHVDSVMIGRGALVKPWLFEEIEKRQYLDKSASQRLEYIEKFTRYGLEAWGSDELGIGFTRRFLLEWLSFAHRYVPVAMLEHLPPKLNERPPAYHGRNDLETLMASDSYTDWIKLSEMFLGPVHPGFQFKPKHKSNAYEAEG